MYKGFSSCIFGTIIYGTAKFQLYQIFKEYNSKNSNEQNLLGDFACGALAGIVASISTHPFEIIRKRRQV